MVGIECIFENITIESISEIHDLSLPIEKAHCCETLIHLQQNSYILVNPLSLTVRKSFGNPSKL